MQLKKDHFLSGFIPGLLLPLVGYYLYYLGFFNYMAFGEFNKHLLKSGLFISVLSLGVILNLGIFFLYYQWKCDRSARGVIAATFIYAFMVMYFKVLR